MTASGVRGAAARQRRRASRLQSAPSAGVPALSHQDHVVPEAAARLEDAAGGRQGGLDDRRERRRARDLDELSVSWPAQCSDQNVLGGGAGVVRQRHGYARRGAPPPFRHLPPKPACAGDSRLSNTAPSRAPTTRPGLTCAGFRCDRFPNSRFKYGSRTTPVGLPARRAATARRTAGVTCAAGPRAGRRRGRSASRSRPLRQVAESGASRTTGRQSPSEALRQPVPSAVNSS